MSSLNNKRTLMIDGHVHFYNMFDFKKFFASAEKNFFRFYPGSEHSGGEMEKILFFTESREIDFFSVLKNRIHDFEENGYQLHNTEEGSSLVLTKNEKNILFIIRGRQIVTQENIEILHIGTEETLKDGLPANKILKEIDKRDEIAILAWGVGKWMFGRRKIVKTLLKNFDHPGIFIGDNSARPVIWPRPQLFSFAEEKGIRILNGSDPLPLPGEETKPGSYFFSLSGKFNPKKPFKSIKDILKSPEPEISFFGKRDSLSSFLKRQFRIYSKKYFS